MDGEKLGIIQGWCGDFDSFQIDALLAAAMPLCRFSARSFDQNAPHCFSSSAKEMGPACPLLTLISYQPEPGLMDERGGLERVSGRLISHLMRRQTAQFVIDQRQQLIGCLGITLLSRFEYACNIAHAERID